MFRVTARRHVVDHALTKLHHQNGRPLPAQASGGGRARRFAIAEATPCACGRAGCSSAAPTQGAPEHVRATAIVGRFVIRSGQRGRSAKKPKHGAISSALSRRLNAHPSKDLVLNDRADSAGRPRRLRPRRCTANTLPRGMIGRAHGDDAPVASLTGVGERLPGIQG